MGATVDVDGEVVGAQLALDGLVQLQQRPNRGVRLLAGKDDKGSVAEVLDDAAGAWREDPVVDLGVRADERRYLMGLVAACERVEPGYVGKRDQGVEGLSDADDGT